MYGLGRLINGVGEGLWGMGLGVGVSVGRGPSACRARRGECEVRGWGLV